VGLVVGGGVLLLFVCWFWCGNFFVGMFFGVFDSNKGGTLFTIISQKSYLEGVQQK